MYNFSNSYNRNNFVDFLESRFLPDDFQTKEEKLNLKFSPKFTTSATRLGVCKSLELEVFEIEHNSTHDARVGISRDAFQIMQKNSYSNKALVAFIPKGSNQYRFSFLQIDAELDPYARLQRNYSNPRRYSYLLGEGAGGHTPNEFLLQKGKVKDEKDLMERFSVEILTKQFYKELFDWYQWAIDERTGVTFPNNITIANTKEQIDTKVIRLITRLMFVWFIKQSELVPGKIFEIDFLKNILKDFDPFSQTSGSYYNAILQNLFFATLNRAILDENGNRRNFAKIIGKQDIKTLYRYDELFSITEEQVIDLFAEIPFLNGGLFECLDKNKTQDGVVPACYHDGFSRNKNIRAFIPNILFFEPEKGLLSILKRYNFTIEENTPQEKQVALDPELLGKVFENLLGAYNPETKESARNLSGSFYTPREIVDYMVNEALIAYLGDTKEIRALFQEEELPEAIKKNLEERERISERLREVKILDPACGSGAYPMGILNRIVEILQKLSGKTDETSIYNEKLQIIENCIFGVDIQNIATQISKLRFFISLICHCRKDPNKTNFGIPTLPNLETKFVSANSLIGLKQQDSGMLDLNDEDLKLMRNQLQNIRHDHFRAKSSYEKITLRKKDEKLRSEIELYVLSQTEEPNYDKIAELEEKRMKLQKELKPYLQPSMVDDTSQYQQASLFGDNKVTLFQKDANEPKRKELTIRIKAIDELITREKNKQKLPDFEYTIKQLAVWNPYDQNNVSSFFDPEWMFGIKDGFDIVIGNPPYIQLQKALDDGTDRKYGDLYKDCHFKTFERTGDIYCLFYERGMDLLKKDGILCYITSNKWMRAGYGKTTRDFFVTKTNPKLLIDFAGVKVFESATVDTNILLLKKENNQNKAICAVTNKTVRDGFKNLSVFVQQNGSECKFGGSESWVILSPIEQQIKRKIEAMGVPLKDWNINIYRGVLTGCNEAFIISGSKRQEILDNCIDENERQKTDALIRPILRGRDIKRYGYDWDGRWLINTHNGVKEKNIPRIYIEDYPAIKAHLDSLWEKIEHRTDQGDTPYNLRNCAYMEDFLKPKIIYPNMTKYMPFVLDKKGYYTNQKCFILTGDNLSYLTAFFNSNLFKICYRDNFPELQGGTRELSKIFFENIKIPHVESIIEEDFDTLVEDMQNGKNYGDIRLERALLSALDLYKEEDYILNYKIQ